MGGGDKALCPFAGATLLDRVLARMAGQGTPVLLSANGDPARFARFGLTVVADSVTNEPEPLDGRLAGMEWAARCAPDVTDVLSVPTDTPFLPPDLGARLAAARQAAGAEVAIAASGGRTHPVVGLWPVRLAGVLRAALTVEGERRVGAWAARHALAVADYGAATPDPFLNVNTPAEVAAAEAAL